MTTRASRSTGSREFDHAPDGVRNTASIVVALSAEDVFDFIADPLNDPKWCADVSGYERLEDGDSGLPAKRIMRTQLEALKSLLEAAD
jgi:hypothetical protein